MLNHQMRDRVLRHAGRPMHTALSGLLIAVGQRHGHTEVTTCSPGVCLVLQGAKQLVVGDQVLRQGPGHTFASAIELPATRCVYETEDGRPYVAVGLIVDVAMLAEFVKDVPVPPSTTAAFNLGSASDALLQAWNHHLALLDTPDDITILAPLRERELLYRLLQSPHGPLLRQMVRDDGKPEPILEAIEWLRTHFDQPLAVKTLAETAGMSVPSFNRHFKAATSTSPLQYQKTLRLQAARHLLARDANAAQAASAVGYGSPSQFSREYARYFGRTPKQDGIRLGTEFQDSPGLV